MKFVDQKWQNVLLRFAALLTSACLFGCGGGGIPAPATEPPALQPAQLQLATWLAPQNDMLETSGVLNPEFKQQTVRQTAHISIGGEQIKIKFSNLFGTSPLILDKVRVAKSIGTGTSEILQPTSTTVLFGGKEGVTIAPGRELYSDAVPLQVASKSDLAVSIYMKQATVRTAHRLAQNDNFIGDGDQTEAPAIANRRTTSSSYFMPEIDVLRSSRTNVIVAFGDSITDGLGSRINGNDRYPDKLTDRLFSGGIDISVVNAGISGNRWVLDNRGPSGSSRFERDVLDIPGVTHVIVLLGINDIGNGYSFARALNDPNQLVTVDKITSTIQTAVRAAKTKGVKVYLATLLPFKGSSYYTDGGSMNTVPGSSTPYNGEAQRQALNAWIRANSAGADGIIDWDLTMGNPNSPLQQRPSFNSGDNLHPNSAGYDAMVNALDLNAFR
jgi:lysophospholipase L1-like esterase